MGDEAGEGEWGLGMGGLCAAGASERARLLAPGMVTGLDCPGPALPSVPGPLRGIEELRSSREAAGLLQTTGQRAQSAPPAEACWQLGGKSLGWSQLPGCSYTRMPVWGGLEHGHGSGGCHRCVGLPLWQEHVCIPLAQTC